MTVQSVSASGRIAPLDGIRGAAVLLVFCFHTIPAAEIVATTPLEQYLGMLFGGGWVGVDLFFALSGFLITGILIDTKGTPHYFLNFFARRTLRIFPLYYLFLLLVFVVLAHDIERLYAPAPSFLTLEHAQAWFWFYIQN